MECTYCQRPTPVGLHLCEACADRLHATLNELPDLLDELHTTAAKLDHTGTGGAARGSNASSSEPPARLDALMLSLEIREISTSWALMLIEHEPTPPHLRGLEPLDYLRRSVNAIRRHDFAGDMLDELGERAAKARRAVDLPRDVRILGSCQQVILDDETGQITTCGGTLKTSGDREHTTCPVCEGVYGVAEWDEWNRQRARGELMRGPDAVRWLQREVKVSITYKDLRNWMDRGEVFYVLERVTSTPRGVRLVWPGDVLKVWQQKREIRHLAQVS